jgi:hypothetical protein
MLGFWDLKIKILKRISFLKDKDPIKKKSRKECKKKNYFFTIKMFKNVKKCIL